MYKVHLKPELEHWLKYFHGGYVGLLTLIVGIMYKAILPGWDPSFFSILDICWRLSGRVLWWVGYPLHHPCLLSLQPAEPRHSGWQRQPGWVQWANTDLGIRLCGETQDWGGRQGEGETLHDWRGHQDCSEHHGNHRYGQEEATGSRGSPRSINSAMVFWWKAPG